jgi:L-fucono-1,5-lactonase
MRIDAHQHFWDLQRFTYSWMPPGPGPLQRNYLPENLEPILQNNRFDGSVIVQANSALEETHWLALLASQHAFVKGVVGWVDLTDPGLGGTLDDLQKLPKFKGVRHQVHDEPDLNWLLRPDVLGGLGELARRGLPYDLLLRPPHLPLVPQLAEKLPSLRMVIDHLAKPYIEKGEIDGWARDMERAAAVPQIWCKLSGMITEGGRDWRKKDLRPYVHHVLKVFGPNRLMFGSDWPACTPAGTWKEVLAAFTQAIGPQPVSVRERLLGGSAVEFYGLT